MAVIGSFGLFWQSFACSMAIEEQHRHIALSRYDQMMMLALAIVAGFIVFVAG